MMPIFATLTPGAAILSTADSQLLVVASTFARDVYEKTLRRDPRDDEITRLRLGRVVLVDSSGPGDDGHGVCLRVDGRSCLFARGRAGGSTCRSIMIRKDVTHICVSGKNPC